MRKLLSFLLAGLALLLVVGCSSGDSAADTPAVKGDAPNTIEAPEGAKNPQDRAAEEQRAAGVDPGDQDGGGQDGH